MAHQNIQQYDRNSRFIDNDGLRQCVEKLLKNSSGRYDNSLWIELGVGWGRVAVPIIELFEKNQSCKCEYCGFDLNINSLEILKKRITDKKIDKYVKKFSERFVAADFNNNFDLLTIFPFVKKYKSVVIFISSFLNHIDNAFHRLRNQILLPILKIEKNIEVSVILFQCEKNLPTLLLDGSPQSMLKGHRILDYISFYEKTNFDNQALLDSATSIGLQRVFKEWYNGLLLYPHEYSLVSPRRLSATDLGPLHIFLSILKFNHSKIISTTEKKWTPSPPEQILDLHWFEYIFENWPYPSTMIKPDKKKPVEIIKNRIKEAIEEQKENLLRAFNTNSLCNSFYTDFWVYEYPTFYRDENFSFIDRLYSYQAPQKNVASEALLFNEKRRKEYLAYWTIEDSPNDHLISSAWREPWTPDKRKSEGSEISLEYQYQSPLLSEIINWICRGGLDSWFVYGLFNFRFPELQHGTPHLLWKLNQSIAFPLVRKAETSSRKLKELDMLCKIRFSSFLFDEKYLSKHTFEINRVVISLDSGCNRIWNMQLGTDSLGNYLQFSIPRYSLASEKSQQFIENCKEPNPKESIEDELSGMFDRIVSRNGLKEDILGKIAGSSKREKASFIAYILTLQCVTDEANREWSYCYYFLPTIPDNGGTKNEGFHSGLGIYSTEALNKKEQIRCFHLLGRLSQMTYYPLISYVGGRKQGEGVGVEGAISDFSHEVADSTGLLFDTLMVPFEDMFGIDNQKRANTSNFTGLVGNIDRSEEAKPVDIGKWLACPAPTLFKAARAQATLWSGAGGSESAIIDNSTSLETVLEKLLYHAGLAAVLAKYSDWDIFSIRNIEATESNILSRSKQLASIEVPHHTKHIEFREDRNAVLRKHRGAFVRAFLAASRNCLYHAKPTTPIQFTVDLVPNKNLIVFSFFNLRGARRPGQGHTKEVIRNALSIIGGESRDSVRFFSCSIDRSPKVDGTHWLTEFSVPLYIQNTDNKSLEFFTLKPSQDEG